MLFSSSRSVIILSDESVQIYSCSSSKTKFIESVPCNTLEFEESVKSCLLKQGRGRPVVILNGMVEQHYRKEKVRKVSVMDQANVLKRRLNVAFPNHPIRASLKLEKEKGDGKTTNYLFAAMPSSESFKKVINAVLESRVSIVGVYLLPVEAAPMVKKLVGKVYSSEQARSVWTIMVGQQRGGGLRQVVTRNGDLALTRMSPVVDTDIEPELWAGEVYSEIKATMSYLSRFGYSEADGLNIVVIANSPSAEVLEKIIDIECNLKVLDIKEAATAVGLRLGKHDDLRYADILYASALGQKSKYILPMSAPTVDRLVKPRKAASYIIFALMAGLAGVAFFLFQGLNEQAVNKDKLLVAEQRLNALQQEYDIELEKKKAVGFDFLLVNNSIGLFEGYQVNKTHLLKTIREIGRSLGADLKIDNIKMTVEDVKKNALNPYEYPEPDLEGAAARPDQELKTAITLSFDEEMEPDVGVSLVNGLRDRLARNLPTHRVEVAKQVAGLSYTGNFAGEAIEENAESTEGQDLKAEIIIIGAVQ